MLNSKWLLSSNYSTQKHGETLKKNLLTQIKNKYIILPRKKKRRKKMKESTKNKNFKSLEAVERERERESYTL